MNKIKNLLFSVSIFSLCSFVSAKSSAPYEIRTYLGKPIVFAASTNSKSRFDLPSGDVLEVKAELVCKTLGFGYNKGQYSLRDLVEQGGRGAREVFVLQDDGSFKTISSLRHYSFRNVICEVPLNLKCKTNHFNLADVKYIQFQREECE